MQTVYKALARIHVRLGSCIQRHVRLAGAERLNRLLARPVPRISMSEQFPYNLPPEDDADGEVAFTEMVMHTSTDSSTKPAAGTGGCVAVRPAAARPVRADLPPRGDAAGTAGVTGPVGRRGRSVGRLARVDRPAGDPGRGRPGGGGRRGRSSRAPPSVPKPPPPPRRWRNGRGARRRRGTRVGGRGGRVGAQPAAPSHATLAASVDARWTDGQARAAATACGRVGCGWRAGWPSLRWTTARRSSSRRRPTWSSSPPHACD